MNDANVGDTPGTMEYRERVGRTVGTAFGGMETFERETLKLAQKPDRPKVGFLWFLFFSAVSVTLNWA